MTITLDSRPIDAPCCVKVKADDGRDVLIQTDWDWPGVASTFGWSPVRVQVNGIDREQIGEFFCRHSGTDGTVDCPDCKVTASEFIQAARQWLDDNDGAETEDPGYFE